MLSIFSQICWPLACLLRNVFTSFVHYLMNSQARFSVVSKKELKKREQDWSQGTVTRPSPAKYKEGRCANHEDSTYFRTLFLLVYDFPHKTEANDQCALGNHHFFLFFFFLKEIRDGLFWSQI